MPGHEAGQRFRGPGDGRQLHIRGGGCGSGPDDLTEDFTRAGLSFAIVIEGNARGSAFRNEMIQLLQRLKEGKSDALTRWMAHQSRRYLAMPALLV